MHVRLSHDYCSLRSIQFDSNRFDLISVRFISIECITYRMHTPYIYIICISKSAWYLHGNPKYSRGMG